MLESYDKFAAPIANRRAGSITETLSRVPNDAGESALGDIIADAQLAATSAETNGGAVIAFTNPGGVRTDVPKKEDGAVSYADLFASQPFRNQLVTLTLTGMQIKNMLEQQWLDPKRPRILQVSRGFNYSWDGAKPYGDRVIADRMSLNGQRIDPATELPRDREQLSRGRGRRLHRLERRNRAAIWRLRRRCPVRLFPGQ